MREFHRGNAVTSVRVRFAIVVALASMLGARALALAQQASGPPTPITPPPSVYTQTPPRLSPPSRPRVEAPSAATTTAAATSAPRIATPPATASTAAAIVHATAPGVIDCGAQLVVWANPATHIYHFSTSDYYGHTKVGSYMCENDAKAQGMRPGRTEVRPK
jgi:hypothetical protein